MTFTTEEGIFIVKEYCIMPGLMMFRFITLRSMIHFGLNCALDYVEAYDIYQDYFVHYFPTVSKLAAAAATP
jgi:hypothetical protein